MTPFRVSRPRAGTSGCPAARPAGSSSCGPGNHDGRPFGRPVKILDQAPARLRGRCADQGSAGSVETAGVAADLAVGGAARLVDDEERGAPVGGAIEPGRCDRSASHPTHGAGAMRHGIRGGASEHRVERFPSVARRVGTGLVLLQRPVKRGPELRAMWTRRGDGCACWASTLEAACHRAMDESWIRTIVLSTGPNGGGPRCNANVTRSGGGWRSQRRTPWPPHRVPRSSSP